MTIKLFIPLIAGLAFASAANAVVITPEPGSNLLDFSYLVNDGNRSIEIYETFGPNTASQIVLKFEQWNYGNGSWTINKYVTNQTGATWNSFSHELLQADKSGSVNNDGLSFAQFGSPQRPRLSDSFTTVTADEDDKRDYLLFTDGLVLSGETAMFTFGLTARRDTADTNPFFLRQAEFLDAVPEPATWAMLITGFGMVGFSMRRRRLTMASVTA